MITKQPNDTVFYYETANKYEFIKSVSPFGSYRYEYSIVSRFDREYNEVRPFNYFLNDFFNHEEDAIMNFDHKAYTIDYFLRADPIIVWNILSGTRLSNLAKKEINEWFLDGCGFPIQRLNHFVNTLCNRISRRNLRDLINEEWSFLLKYARGANQYKVIKDYFLYSVKELGMPINFTHLEDIATSNASFYYELGSDKYLFRIALEMIQIHLDNQLRVNRPIHNMNLYKLVFSIIQTFCLPNEEIKELLKDFEFLRFNYATHNSHTFMDYFITYVIKQKRDDMFTALFVPEECFKDSYTYAAWINLCIDKLFNVECEVKGFNPDDARMALMKLAVILERAYGIDATRKTNALFEHFIWVHTGVKGK